MVVDYSRFKDVGGDEDEDTPPPPPAAIKAAPVVAAAGAQSPSELRAELKRADETAKRGDLAGACAAWVKLHPHLEAAGLRAEAADCMRQARRLLKRVEEGRDEGNACFGKKKYREAVEAYSEALRVCPQDGTLLGNRSAAYLMTAQPRLALADADAALHGDGTRSKLHYRRAKALEQLNQWLAAAAAYDRAVELEDEGANGKVVAAMRAAAAAARARVDAARTTFSRREEMEANLATWKATKRLRSFCEGVVEDDPEFANVLFASMLPSTRKGTKGFDDFADKEKIKVINEWKQHWDDHLRKSLADGGVDGEATIEATPRELEYWAPLLGRVAPARRVLSDVLDLNLPPVVARWEWAPRAHTSDRCDEARMRRRYQSRTMMERLGTRTALRFANRRDALVYEFYTAEFVAALAKYLVRRLAPVLNARGKAMVLDVGSGDGRLLLLLREALPPEVVLVGCDVVAHPAPAYPITLATHSDVLTAVKPDLCLVCWHPPKQDLTAAFRDQDHINEYVLLGPPDSHTCGHETDTWEVPEGWHRKTVLSVSRFMLSRYDLPEIFRAVADPEYPEFTHSFSAAVSFRRGRPPPDADDDSDEEDAPPPDVPLLKHWREAQDDYDDDPEAIVDRREDARRAAEAAEAAMAAAERAKPEPGPGESEGPTKYKPRRDYYGDI